MVIDELGNLAKGVDLSSTDLKLADDRVARLLDLSEGLIELIADSGVETSDAPLIRVVIDTAKQISAAFEAAVERGDIRLDQLMDENYREIPGTNPKQYLTDYVAFTDRILPPIQDPIQKTDPRIVFCVAWAKGGYLPTHNPNYRLPQGPDPVWNNANCRNRRLFRRSRGAQGGGEHQAVPAADLPARHGRRQFRADEGPLLADPAFAAAIGAPSAWASGSRDFDALTCPGRGAAFSRRCRFRFQTATSQKAVIPRHRVSPPASPMTGSSGVASTPRTFASITDASEYWIIRFRG